jgi:hypothetical protein
LVIKELTIEHFGKIKRFEASFHEQLTEISDSNTNDIIQAIGLITANKSLTDHVADNAILSGLTVFSLMRGIVRTTSTLSKPAM